MGKHMEMWKRTLCVAQGYMGSLERGHTNGFRVWGPK